MTYDCAFFSVCSIVSISFVTFKYFIGPCNQALLFLAVGDSLSNYMCSSLALLSEWCDAHTIIKVHTINDLLPNYLQQNSKTGMDLLALSGWYDQYQPECFHFPRTYYLVPILGWLHLGAQANIFFNPACCSIECMTWSWRLAEDGGASRLGYLGFHLINKL